MSDAPVWHRLSPAAARRIDEICDRFEAAWKAGSRPAPEEYLSGADEPERSELLRQLLLLDWDFRRCAGDRPASGDYLARFPADHALIDDVGREVSRHADDTPWPDSFESKLREEAVSGSARYELLQEVGHGGAGVVYRGRDRLLGRELAVKVLRDVHRQTPEIYRRFVEEARIGSRLQHPAIVPVYEMGWFDDRRPYFTMKLVEGRTLAALLKERSDPAQDRPRLLGVFEQVCQAMAYAHAQGVVHRDLKPANIMVGAFGEVQVMDWGFAKILGGEGELPPAMQNMRDTISAVQANGGPGGSQSGVMMGTPAYMPPEQARGEACLIDARADVFALGAVLCEILTGAPPYVGAGFHEVCLMAAEGDLADASKRLDACGADAPLRELAKRCLAANRADRPPNAEIVARDVAAYLASAQEQVHQAQLERASAEARAEEARAKAKAERRARRLTLALAAAAVVLAAAAGFGWLQYDRFKEAQSAQTAALDGKVEAALVEADGLVERKAWDQAAATATRARELMDRGASDRWKRRVHELAADVEIAARIDKARLLTADDDRAGKAFTWQEAMHQYAAAFDAYGVRSAADPTEAVGRLTQRPPSVRETLTAGLQDWWLLAVHQNDPAKDWLGAVLQAADPDEWRTRVREAVTSSDRKRLVELAASADAAAQPEGTVTLLAWALMGYKAYDAAIVLLRPAQLRHPDDFWINFELGRAQRLRQRPDYAESLRFYSIAGSLRPAIAYSYYVNLAGLLIQRKNWDGAVAASRRALELQPDCAEAYNHLGIGLENLGEWAQAQAAYRKAVELQPDLAGAWYNLGTSLERHDGPDEAVAALDRAVQLTPRDPDVHEALCRVREQRKEFGAALDSCDEAIKLNPRYAAAFNERGNILMQMGRVDDAITAYEKAVSLDPLLDATYDNLGGAWYRQQQFERAVAACSRAVELNPRSAWYQYNLGRMRRAASDLTGAVAAYREAIRLDPSLAEPHCNLGLALKDQGLFAEALIEIQEGHRLGSARSAWRYPSAAWVKEARRLVEMEARLPTILDGSKKPATAEEAVEYASLCRLKDSYAASARLYAAAFAAAPALAESVGSGHRRQAACVAAQAGCGQGGDALDAAEQARWRKQALDWLRADLAAWADAPDAPSAAGALKGLRAEKTLAGIREPEELAKLPESERADCIRFWADVQDLLVRRLAKTPGE